MTTITTPSTIADLSHETIDSLEHLSIQYHREHDQRFLLAARQLVTTLRHPAFVSLDDTLQIMDDARDHAAICVPANTGWNREGCPLTSNTTPVPYGPAHWDI